MLAHDDALALRCESAELAAFRAYHAAFPRAAALALGAGSLPIGAGLLVHANLDVLMFNMVLGLGVEAAACEAELDEALSVFARRRAPRCMVSLAPRARPRELARWLEARGFQRHDHWIRLVRDVSPVEPCRTRLDIGVFGRERSQEYGQLVGEALGHPVPLAPMVSGVVECEGWHHFGAFDGSQLVAGAALFIHDGTAWFGSAATCASHRGLGAHSALIEARIDFARGVGCEWITVETAADLEEQPNPSTRNLRRLGFRDLYERPNWVKVLREG
jgi:GNAT superfamily N-acetyltransferase